jgi:hypothetical protein
VKFASLVVNAAATPLARSAVPGDATYRLIWSDDRKQLSAGKTKTWVAIPAGFEPATHGVEIRCQQYQWVNGSMLQWCCRRKEEGERTFGTIVEI